MADPRAQFINMLQQMHGGGGPPQPMPGGPPQGGGGPLGPMAEASAPPGSADGAQIAALVAQLQKVFPKLLLAEENNGRHHLAGPAQDQFLAAVYAKAHGAKHVKVANEGRGQHLQVGM